MVLVIRVAKGNIQSAFRALRRKVFEAGLPREVQRRRAYEKPCDKRARKRAEQERRAERRELMHNLSLILARRARGF